MFDTAIDESTIAAFSGGIPKNFTVSRGTSALPSTVTLDRYSYMVATFTPKLALEKRVEYTCKITKEVKDKRGSSLSKEKTWSFITSR